jgi:uncharacterized protein
MNQTYNQATNAGKTMLFCFIFEIDLKNVIMRSLKSLCVALLFIFLVQPDFFAQTIGTFNSIQPTAQTQNLVLPSTHTFQRIIKTGDALSLGGNLGANLDFTGYVPISGSSTNGYLSISSEVADAAECSILTISFNSIPKLWNINSGGKVSFPFADLGTVTRFCSGTITPDNTVMICEEAAGNGDGNGDGYQDRGWVIEIDPQTRTVKNQDGIGGADKLWAVGRQVHENVSIKPDESVIYWGADANPTGYMYKFVPAVPGNYTSGQLFVLVTTGALGNGTWQQVPNTTQLERNNTIPNSTAAGAFNFDGIEDVEIGPDGRIYFTAKGPGRVYRFTDNGTTVNNLQVFVESTSFDVDDAGPFVPEPWGVGNDNLAFDGEGNLWVLQDGSRNHIWVVGPSHTPASPSIRLFATTPLGSEPTGITFSPDYRFMFISFQHPNVGNTSSQNDAAGSAVVFNTHTTVVIARKEFLGNAAVPVTFTGFELKPQNRGVHVSWKVEQAFNHHYFVVERSNDGIQFAEIHRDQTVISNSSGRQFNYLDQNLPFGAELFYRIKQCDIDGTCRYSSTRSIKVKHRTGILHLHPVPTRDNLLLRYISGDEKTIVITIIDVAGKKIISDRRTITKGMNSLSIQTEKLPPGLYNALIVDNNGFTHQEKFIRQ